MKLYRLIKKKSLPLGNSLEYSIINKTTVSTVIINHLKTKRIYDQCVTPPASDLSKILKFPQQKAEIQSQSMTNGLFVHCASTTIPITHFHVCKYVQRSREMGHARPSHDIMNAVSRSPQTLGSARVTERPSQANRSFQGGGNLAVSMPYRWVVNKAGSRSRGGKNDNDPKSGLEIEFCSY